MLEWEEEEEEIPVTWEREICPRLLFAAMICAASLATPADSCLKRGDELKHSTCRYSIVNGAISSFLYALALDIYKNGKLVA